MFKRTALVLSALALAIGVMLSPTLAPAQTFSTANASTFYPGTQTIQQANYILGTQTFTAASQNGSAITLPGVSAAVISAVGTSFTTAVIQLQGSVDGTNWSPLLLAAIAVPGTTATTETVTANGLYVANLGGLKAIRLVTTSGTFTGTSLALTISASPLKGQL